ncbi:anthocyanin 5-aromatic acyltransferase [Phtheirospermum japonicum]|uniref:Anthocyanin 5-aromatic acyltransferase n=1 Tax=Phtheirospermum japonicum TaxID=374723 RepID=A0A830CVM5_9LAMI|nr:anthocyanin 5-aromatic acyltransferase [Phtheirospermum japonicum]
MATKIIEQCQVAPSSGAPSEQLLKLLHMDMIFLRIPNVLKTLVFYIFPCSESHFLDIIVPNLKNSLSLTLKHFPPMAAKIVIDNNSGMPVSHYIAGQDSFPLTIVISNADFVNLTGYHPRDAHLLHNFAPHLSETLSPTTKLTVAAIQVTLFPDQGVCIGLTRNHAIGDGATTVRFMQMWASINKYNGDDSHLLALGEKYLPSYDRGLVRDGDRLAMECWRQMTTRPPSATTSLSSVLSSHARRFQATFVLREAEIQQLKNLVVAVNSKKVRVSSFVVACAHLWTCLVKSAGEDVGDDERYYFGFPVDCRWRSNPPLPDNYFGNCSTIVMTESTYGKLRGREGFLAAAEAVGEAIQKTIGNGRRTMDGSVKFFVDSVERVGEMMGKRMVLVGGSSRFGLYGVDYGWGRAVKCEALQGDRSEVVYISESREYRGGIEIGVSMPKAEMDAFAASFGQGLAEATEKLWCKM